MSRNLSTKMLVLGIVIIITTFTNEKVFLWLGWSFQLMIFSRMLDYTQAYYGEIEEDYPKEEYIIPKYAKYFFEYIEPNIGLPKELVYEIWAQFGILVSVIISTITANLIREYIIVCVVWGTGLAMSVLSDIIFSRKAYKKAFLN